jgi:succinate dehydrogenase flavin-adding protein (antitoxin of CptAB toxin-antitoxin module)
LLELDLVFEKFWARGTGLSVEEMAAMERLLTMPDNDLLDLVMGRSETGDPEIRAVVEKLRAA